MKDIMPKYSTPKEYKKTFVKGYTRFSKGNAEYMSVDLEGKRPWIVEATRENISKTENAMQRQTAYQVKEILPSIKKDFKLEACLALFGTALALGTKLVGIPGLDENVNNMIHYALGAIGTSGIILGSTSISKLKEIKKWEYFFDNERELNNDVGESYNMLSGTSRRTQKAIVGSGEERFISPTNLDKISFHDLRVIEANIQAQKDLNLEFNNPIEKKLI